MSRYLTPGDILPVDGHSYGDRPQPSTECSWYLKLVQFFKSLKQDFLCEFLGFTVVSQST